jgi:phospholipid-binding lipoprotein MlaA
MNNPSSTAKPRCRGLLAAVGAALLLGGCATAQNPRDPFEKFNRAMFSFNDTVDTYALKPAATAYHEHTPSFFQTGVNNFFGNLADLWSAVNNLLQGKGQDGMNDLTRFGFNSTFGMLGLLDIASEAGIRKHNEDLGQTLGYWGVPSGPYLMLPLLGPSTVRDTAALPADFWGDPWSHKYPVGWRNVGIGVRAIDQRATVLDASTLLEEAALDRYEFIRDGYLQRRESRVYDDERSRARKPEPKAEAEEAAPQHEAAPLSPPQEAAPKQKDAAPQQKDAPAPPEAAPQQKDAAPPEPAAPQKDAAPQKPATPAQPAAPTQPSTPTRDAAKTVSSETPW